MGELKLQLTDLFRAEHFRRCMHQANQLTGMLLQFVLYPSVPLGNLELYVTSILGLALSSVV